MKTNETYEVLESYFCDEDVYYLVDKDDIKKCDLCDCYNNYGQQIGHTDAGDYSLHNTVEDSAICDMRQEGRKVFGESFADVELDYNGEDIYISNYDELEGITASEEEINEWLNNWEKNNAYYIEADAITWWNGHNYESKMLDAEECFAELKRIDGGEILADFEKALQRGDVSKDEHIYEYRGDKYCFIKKCGYPRFYEYEVVELTDLE